VTGELLVTLDEVARRLSLCRRSVQQLIYDAALPSVRVGRRRLVAVVDLEAFVSDLRSPTETLPETTKAPSRKLSALNDGGISSAPTAAA
jgi:excisionase family DNA binding protein